MTMTFSSSCRIGAVALALVLSGGAAFAQCLTAADLGRGIVFGYDGGNVTTVRRLNDGTQEIVERYADGGNPIRFVAVHGIYFTQEFEIDAANRPVPETRLDILFPVDPLGLPRPVPGGGWQGNTVNVFEDGYRRDEVTTIAFSAAPVRTISGCDYDSVRADLRYDWGDEGGLTLVYHYLPALDTAYVASSSFDGDTATEDHPVSLTLMTK